VTTPVVSAIGHEPDSPLLDLVADVRASTPTDAAKRLVPDVAEEAQRVLQVRERGRLALRNLLGREQQRLTALRSRPALADPRGGLAERSAEIEALRERARRSVGHRLDRAGDDLAHRLARVRSLSPLSTLRRGYAVVQDAAGTVVTDPANLVVGQPLDIRVAGGRIGAGVTSAGPDLAHTTAGPETEGPPDA
jgi:exodeoxyribonuclease VII large subunit